MKILLFASVVLMAARGHSLQITPFQDWSGEAIRRTQALPNPVSLVIIQHTVTKECLTDETCRTVLRGMRKYSIDTGFDDVPYNFMIGGNGIVYDGAGWEVVGAHTKFYNNKSIGIGFIGDFREKSPTPEALQAAQDLISYGVENGHLSEDYKLVGHRQLSKTVSPGDVLQKIIEGWPHWTSGRPSRR